MSVASEEGELVKPAPSPALSISSTASSTRRRGGAPPVAPSGHAEASGSNTTAPAAPAELPEPAWNDLSEPMLKEEHEAYKIRLRRLALQDRDRAQCLQLQQMRFDVFLASCEVSKWEAQNELFIRQLDEMEREDGPATAVGSGAGSSSGASGGAAPSALSTLLTSFQTRSVSAPSASSTTGRTVGSTLDGSVDSLDMTETSEAPETPVNG